MKIPPGMEFHGWGYTLRGGDEIPEELLARLPSDHPFKGPAKPAPDKGK